MEFDVTHRLDRLTALYDALWAERFQVLTLAASALALGSFAAMLLWPEARLFAVALLAAGALSAAFCWQLRATMRRQVRDQLEGLNLQVLHYRISDEGLHERSAVGDCMLRWHAFAAPREVEGFLVLPRRPVDAGLVIALPLHHVSAEVRRTIEDRIAHAANTPVG